MLTPVEHSALAIFNKGLSSYLRTYQEARAREAAETLRKAMARGKVYRITDDKAAAALFAYMRAAEEGAARLNLEMIAEAFANSAQEATFAPDEFRRHTRMLADLSREEIVVIAALIKANRGAHGLSFPQARKHIRDELENELVGSGKFFATVRHVTQHLTALQRTGLIIYEEVYGGQAYMPTSLLVQIERLIDFDRASVEAAKQPS